MVWKFIFVAEILDPHQPAAAAAAAARSTFLVKFFWECLFSGETKKLQLRFLRFSTTDATLRESLVRPSTTFLDFWGKMVHSIQDLVAHIVEWLLPRPTVHSSNPVNYVELLLHCWLMSTVIFLLFVTCQKNCPDLWWIDFFLALWRSKD